jgi:glycosyltransferase involved in cell wall biosynthesis
MSGARYRILYHHRTQALDGQRVHIHEIQNALRAMGHEVVEVAPLATTEAAGTDATRSLSRRLIEKAAEWTPAGMYEAAELAYNAVAYRRLARTVARIKPDFIYERYCLNTCAGIWAARRFALPILLEVNSPIAEEKTRLGKLMFPAVARRVERYVVRNAIRTLAVTDVLKRLLIESTGVDAGRIQVVQNGVDVQRFEAASVVRRDVRQRLRADADVLVGAVGFFRDWHGIDLLLHAVHADPLLRRATRVLLVGDGPAVPRLRELVSRLGIEDRVTFLGTVPHHEVPPLVAAIDVVLIPRATEYASPLKLFEYMAARKAIVAPRQPNLAEVLTDGVDALFFSPEDAMSLQGALARVVADEGLRRRLGDGASQTIAGKDLTWAGNARRIIGTFEALRGEQVAPAVLASSRA